MKAITNFEKTEEYPMKISLYGTLGEFQKLVGHLDKNWAEPMATFMSAIHEQVDIAEKQIENKFDLPD